MLWASAVSSPPIRVVHDLDPSLQLTDRPSLLRRCQRRPCLGQVSAANLGGHDPAVALGDALPEDLWVPDLSRQRTSATSRAMSTGACAIVRGVDRSGVSFIRGCYPENVKPSRHTRSQVIQRLETA
jgi:hypothetical protein